MPTPAEELQARQLLTHVQQTVDDATLFLEAMNPPIPEPVPLEPRLRAHLNVLNNPNAARPAKLAALRAIFRIKGGKEP
jgi:hypothetical protein